MNISQTVTERRSPKKLPPLFSSPLFPPCQSQPNLKVKIPPWRQSLRIVSVCGACSDRPTVYNIYYVGIINCNMGQIHFRTCGHFSFRCSPSNSSSSSSSCSDVCLGRRRKRRRRRRRSRRMPVRRRPFPKKGSLAIGC